MIKIFGCGDIFIAKRLPQSGYCGMDEICNVIQSYDVRFGNLETTVHDNEGYPSRFPGGGYAMAPPLCLHDLRRLGFNMLSIANNHTLDYSHRGLEATIRHLKDNEITYCGAGMNLIEAAMPKYIECKEGRVAFIGATSSFHDSDAAGYASGAVSGRPGINPLGRIEYYKLEKELYQAVERIAKDTGMNDGHNWSMDNGYRYRPQGVFLRDMNFIEADHNGRVTHPNEVDLKRILMSISEAKTQSDCIVVSIHSHQMERINTKPADFIREFCMKCIDYGANIVFGHGPHEIRGMEVYKDGLIFYGMGDFVLHNEMQSVMPYEFYEKTDIEYSLYNSVGMAMEIRSKKNTVGLQADRKAWEAISVGIEFEKERISKVRIYPISLGYEMKRTIRGWPKLDKTGSIINYFSELSAQYGTEIKVSDNMGYLEI